MDEEMEVVNIGSKLTYLKKLLTNPKKGGKEWNALESRWRSQHIGNNNGKAKEYDSCPEIRVSDEKLNTWKICPNCQRYGQES